MEVELYHQSTGKETKTLDFSSWTQPFGSFGSVKSPIKIPQNAIFCDFDYDFKPEIIAVCRGRVDNEIQKQTQTRNWVVPGLFYKQNVYIVNIDDGIDFDSSEEKEEEIKWQISHNFEFLTGAPDSFSWISSGDGKMEEGAVVGGRGQNGELLFIGRFQREFEKTGEKNEFSSSAEHFICGVVVPSRKMCFAVWADKVHRSQTYEILIGLPPGAGTGRAKEDEMKLAELVSQKIPRKSVEEMNSSSLERETRNLLPPKKSKLCIPLGSTVPILLLGVVGCVVSPLLLRKFILDFNSHKVNVDFCAPRNESDCVLFNNSRPICPMANLPSTHNKINLSKYCEFLCYCKVQHYVTTSLGILLALAQFSGGVFWTCFEIKVWRKNNKNACNSVFSLCGSVHAIAVITSLMQFILTFTYLGFGQDVLDQIFMAWSGLTLTIYFVYTIVAQVFKFGPLSKCPGIQCDDVCKK